MFSDKFVFAQLVAFLAMMFVQLANRESLRDLIVALDAHRSKCYHLRMGKNRNPHLHEQIKIGIITSSRSMLSTSFARQERDVAITSSNSVAMSMLSILRPSTSV